MILCVLHTKRIQIGTNILVRIGTNWYEFKIPELFNGLNFELSLVLKITNKALFTREECYNHHNA